MSRGVAVFFVIRVNTDLIDRVWPGLPWSNHKTPS